MQLNYENARHLEGELIRYKNGNGEWVTGRVVKVRKDGLEIVELNGNSSVSSEGYGWGFWGPRPFFFPFAGFGFGAFWLF